MKTVVVSGASSGIGKSIARQMAESGWRVYAGVRSDDDAEQLSQINKLIFPVNLDVTDRPAIENIEIIIRESLRGRKLDGLVNNAGIAKPGPISLQSVETIRQHMEVNVMGAVNMMQIFAPLLGQDEGLAGQPGRIVNITSLGGQIPSPFIGAYTATKHALESLTDTVRMELKLFGIDAITVGPGAVNTPIWQKALDQDQAPFEKTPFGAPMRQFLEEMASAGENGLEPDEVAAAVHQALSSRFPKRRYTPAPNKLTNYYLLKALPLRLKDKLLTSRFGLERS